MLLQPVPDGTIVATDKIQIGSEIILVNSVTNFSNYTQITVTRAQDGTAAVGHLENQSNLRN